MNPLRAKDVAADPAGALERIRWITDSFLQGNDVTAIANHLGASRRTVEWSLRSVLKTVTLPWDRPADPPPTGAAKYAMPEDSGEPRTPKAETTR